MADKKYTKVTNQLESLLKSSPRNSESQNAIACGRAQAIVRDSKLTQDEQITVLKQYPAKPTKTGYYYENNGIRAGIEAIESLTPKEPEPVARLNYKNFQNLVSNCAIFSVEFIKRSNGELRKMICRMGVKKHLRGGDKAYDPKTT